MKNFLIKKPCKFRCKHDIHPKKLKSENWWECLGFFKSKSAKRQSLKNYMKDEDWDINVGNMMFIKDE